MLCQLCGSANPDGRDTCRRCGHDLLVVSGVGTVEPEIDDEAFIEAQEHLEEHLLERITSLEESVRKLGATLAAFSERLAQLEHSQAVAMAGVENIAKLMEDEGVVSRTEITDGWEQTTERELTIRDLSRRFRARQERILSRARQEGRASEPFARKLKELEPAFFDNDMEVTRELLVELGRMAPDNDELWSFIGEAAFASGESPLAETAFQRVIELRGAHFETLVYLGNAAADLEHWDRAREALRRARAMVPESFLPELALGGLELRRGNHQRAARHLEASAARQELPQTFFLLGSAHLELGQNGRAITALQRAVELEPSFEAAMDHLGDAYLRRGWRRRALETFKHLERLDPHRLRYRETARLLSRRRSNPIPPDTVRLIDQADAALAAGHRDAALDLYEAAGRTSPGEPAFTAAAALLASTTGRHRRAVTLAHRVLEEEAETAFTAAATAALLEALRSAGRPRAARRVAESIYTLGDDFSRGIAAYELALIESELDGDLAYARSLAREALEAAPRELRSFPLAALAIIALQRGRLDEAHSHLERVAKLSGAEDDHPQVPTAPGVDDLDEMAGIDTEMLNHVHKLSTLARQLARH